MRAIELIKTLQELGPENRLNIYVIDKSGEKIYIDDDITIEQHSPNCAIVVSVNVGDKISDEERYRRITTYH